MVAVNSHLRDRALPPADQPPTPYAWIPFLVNEGFVDLDELPAGYSAHHNSLTSNLLRGMKTLVDVPHTKVGSIAEVGLDALAIDRENFIRPQYLAAVTLLLVYLHECAHILLAHNELVPI
jgi:hypothetical protein